MRSAALVPLLAVIAVPPAAAQVTVNLRALDALPRAPAPRHHRPIHRRPAEHRATVARRALPLPPSPAPAQLEPKAVAASAPAVPATPPAPPPARMTATIPAAPPAPAPALATATVAPEAGPRHLEVRFAAGATTLSPEAAQAVTALGKSVHRTPETSFEVDAHAPATGDDPSTARRLSLARALAIRAALIQAGVPAASVYMRALGAPPPSEAGEANRARITVMGLASSPVPQQAKQP